MRSQVAASNVVAFFCQHHNGAALGSFIRQRSQLRRACQVALFNPWRGIKRRRGSIAERDCARLIEQQNIHVARSFDGPPGHRDDVSLNETVHSRNPDRREQTPDCCRNQTHQKRNEHENVLARDGINRERLKRDHRQQKNDGQARQ